jgi:hypothetical protein
MVINRALTPLSDVRHFWREQPAHQLGSLAEAPLLGRSRCGEFGLDLAQHRRQRDGEREEGWVQ